MKQDTLRLLFAQMDLCGGDAKGCGKVDVNVQRITVRSVYVWCASYVYSQDFETYC